MSGERLPGLEPGRGLVLTGSREQADLINRLFPDSEALAFADLSPDETAGENLWLLVTCAGPADWIATADLDYADLLYRRGAASIRWLYVPELPGRPAEWPRVGLTPAAWAEKLAGAPLLPIKPEDPAERDDEGDFGDPEEPGRPFYFNWRRYTVDKYLDREEELDEPILADSLFRGDTGLIVAPGGTGKGFGAAQLGAALASGHSSFGPWEVPRPFRVMYVSAEESQKTVRRRARGAVKRLGLCPIETREAGGRYLCRSIRGLGNPHLVQPDGRGGLEKTQALIDLYEQAGAFRPDIIFLDHFAKFVPCNEIDNMALTGACGFLEELAVNRHCAVILLHHASKTGPVFARQTDDLFRSLDPAAIRGGSSLAANVRWALMMTPLTGELAAKILGPAAAGGRAGAYVAARVAKKNEGRAEEIFYLKHDEEGFFEPVEAVDQEEGSKADAIRLAREVARREGDASARPLTASRGVRLTFGWGMLRAGKAVETALNMGLVTESRSRSSRGTDLRPGFRKV